MNIFWFLLLLIRIIYSDGHFIIARSHQSKEILAFSLHSLDAPPVMMLEA